MNWRKYISYPALALKNKSHHLLYLKRLEQSAFWPKEELQKYNLIKLKELLVHAGSHVPYYIKLFSDIGFNPQSFEAIEDLSKLPLLTKRNIQESLEDLVSTDIDKECLIKDKTGGSTASPLVFYYDNDRFDWRKAAEIRHNRWIGYDIGTKCAIIWGARKDFAGKTSLKSRVREFLTGNNLILDASSLTEEGMSDFASQLNKFKPHYILAYAQALAFFAKYLQDTGTAIRSPRGIITSAELLSQSDRTLIESVLGAPVYDRYGCREVSVIASECLENTMHINEECLHVEFVKEDGSACSYGEEGQILITDLLNHAMPLIRYKIGDLGVLLNVTCPCGINLAAMKMVSGRTTDFIITPKGRHVSGAAITAYVITNIEGIGRVQIYQKSRDKIIVKMVKNNRFNEKTVPLFEDRLKSFLDGIDPTIELVDNIPVPESGKLQFCVNDLLRFP